MTNLTILFIHGFGVMKDARGMFTDLSSAFNDKTTSLLVDLNIKEGNNIHLNSFSKQIEIIENIRDQYKDQAMDLICHSEGCLVTALAFLPNIRKTIFIAPSLDTDNRKIIDRFLKNPQTKIDLNEQSIIARRDGTFTIIDSDYWKEREAVDVVATYTNYLKNNEVYVIKALSDGVVDNQNLENIFKDAKEIIKIEADHNFTNSREELIKECSRLLLENEHLS